MKIFNMIKTRKVLWLMPAALIALFIVDFQWIVLGTILYFPLFRWFTLTYHEYQVHKYICPKNNIVEFIGYFILAVWEWQSPIKKLVYHQIHHDFSEDPVNDPTAAKLRLTDSAVLYCFDMSPHANIPYYDATPAAVETRMYQWFNQNWSKVLIITVLGWLIFLPFWTFLAFYIWPMFIWNIIYRTTDLTFHKWELADKPWFCLYLGTSAYHGRHHLDDSYSRETYYGKGFWRYLNIDYYITGLLFKDY